MPGASRVECLLPWSTSRRSREPLELLEVGLPLLEERFLPFLAFGRHVVEQRRASGELLQPGLAIAVGVERGLQEADRGGAVLQHLAAPLDGLRLQLLE